MAIANGYFTYSAGVVNNDLTVTIANNSDRILGIQICARGETVSSVTLDPGGNNEAATQLQNNVAGNANVYTYYIINPTEI